MPVHVKWRPKSGLAFDIINYMGFFIFSIIVLFPFWDTFLLWQVTCIVIDGMPRLTTCWVYAILCTEMFRQVDEER